MNKPVDAPLSKSDKAAIAAHASDIYSRLPGKLALTPQNEPGNRDLAQRAIDLAEYFHEQLGKRGYIGGIRHEK